jgi:hypothetical protein
MLVGDAFSYCNGSSTFFFPGDDPFDKSGNLEYRTYYRVLDVYICVYMCLYVSLAAVY